MLLLVTMYISLDFNFFNILRIKAIQNDLKNFVYLNAYTTTICNFDKLIVFNIVYVYYVLQILKVFKVLSGVLKLPKQFTTYVKSVLNNLT